MVENKETASVPMIERVYESFEILPDWRVTGSVDDSGMTRFEGIVERDGSFTAKYLRLGGTMTGFVNADGSVTGQTSIRGRGSGFNGWLQRREEGECPFSGEYRVSFMIPRQAAAGRMGTSKVIRTEELARPYPRRGGKPIGKRGIKFNLPLDMRTPSYTDAGDSAQSNIPNVWSMEFWRSHLDMMAELGYNVLSLWNLNPFPSMVKVPEYPDVALEDVWRTTLPFDDSYNGTATNLVRPEHYENYEVVKKMTIDEKIAFWREVMAYAHKRGIEIYLITWSIYTYGEQGKYGITHEATNPITTAYFRASVRELIRTYPDLDGIGVVCGEQMAWEDGRELENEKWLWSTYGLGVCDALAEQPERRFRVIHRLHLTDFTMAEDVWKDLPCPMDYSDKYSIAHMYSSPEPTFVRPTVARLPKGRKLWLEVRNDDIYQQRWGDPDYARKYLRGMPDDDVLAGFLMGADGYVPACEYACSEEEQGMLLLRKHWYNYLLWGKLALEPNTEDSFFLDAMADQYPGVERVALQYLMSAMSAAGKIIPQVSRLYFQSTDAPWFPEACWSHSYVLGFLNIRRWMKSNNVMPDGGCMSIQAYAKALVEGEVLAELQTPYQVSETLLRYADDAVDLVEKAFAVGVKNDNTHVEREVRSVLMDQMSMAWLGRYYARKINAAVAMQRFALTGDECIRSEAVSLLKEALVCWKEYAGIYSRQYRPQQLARHGWLDVTALTEQVEKDIKLAQSYVRC